MPELVYPVLLLGIVPLSYHFVFLCFQLPPNVIAYRFVRRGSILLEYITPRFEKQCS